MISWWHLVTLFIATFWFDLASCFTKLTEGQLLRLLVIHTNFLEGFILMRDFSCDFSCIFCLLFLQLILFIFCCQICLWWSFSGEIYQTIHPCRVSSINSLLSSSHFPNISTHHRKFLLIFLMSLIVCICLTAIFIFWINLLLPLLICLCLSVNSFFFCS